MSQPWVILIIAGLFETAFATCLGKAKESSGQSFIFWIIAFLVCLSISMFLLYKATLQLPIGTAYAVWTGIGAVGTAIIGILLFKESTDLWRIFFISTLIASIIGLKLVTK
jgi:quaternary ammonium compound-resistance protein SugE